MLLDYIEWFDANDDGGDEGTPPPKDEPKKTLKDDTNLNGGEELKKVEQEAYSRGQKEYKRELSKTLGINLFEEKELNSFVASLSNKIDKTELEAQQTRLTELEETASKYNNLQLENALFKANVNETYIDRAKQLATTDVETKGITYEEAAQNIVKEMPFFVASQRQKAGMDHNSNPDNISEAEQYKQDKYANNPYYKKNKK